MLNNFFRLLDFTDYDFIQNKDYIIFNEKIEKNWKNIIKFIILHYFTNNPINDYWKHYKDIQNNNTFEYFEKYPSLEEIGLYPKSSYYSISLGLKIKEYSYDFEKSKHLENTIHDYLKINTNKNINLMNSHNEVLNQINQKQLTTLFYQ
jgi:hypothetical protein